MVMQRTNPLADVLRTVRAELAGIITTLSVEFETASEVTQFPVESGRSVADHTTAQPTRITITGRVPDGALGGAGPRDVEAAFRSLLSSGAPQVLSTPRGVYENCVVTRVRSGLSASNLRGLDISVVFTQVLVAEVVEVPSSPVLDDLVGDDEFKDVLEEAGLDGTSDVLESDPYVAKVQARLLGIDDWSTVREVFARMAVDGVDPNTAGYFKAREYVEAVLDVSGPMFTALQSINPQLIPGRNIFDIPLPQIEAVRAEAERTAAASGGRAVVTPPRRPSSFTINATLQTDDNRVVRLRLRFRYEYAQTPGAAVGLARPSGRTAVWYLDYDGAPQAVGVGERVVQGLQRLVDAFTPAEFGLVGRNIRLRPGAPIKLGGGNGELYVIPRYGVEGADRAIRLYSAFVGVTRPPAFRLIHVNDPGALVPRASEADAIRRIVEGALEGG